MTSAPHSAWLVSYHMTQAWPVIRLHRPLVPEHAVHSAFLLSNLNQNSAAAHLQRPHITGQSAQLLTLTKCLHNNCSTSLRLTKKSRKNHIIPLRKPSKFNATPGKTYLQMLLGHLSGIFAISSLLKPQKLVSFFLLIQSFLLV